MSLSLLSRNAFRRIGSTSMQPCRCRMASSSVVEEKTLLSPVYVHQVSKNVLQHMQKNHHDWLTSSGLDGGLFLNANGTFTLQFPMAGGRIWTSYDISTRQHWLSVYRRKLKTRFLLKDGAQHNSTTVQTTETSIGACVDHMIEMINDSNTQSL